ncbi:MAG: hypothetical protein ACRELA_19110 [Candidatus Rokuibacteriota bacterium]
MSPPRSRANLSGALLVLTMVCALPGPASGQLEGCGGFDPYISSKGQLGEVNWQGNLLVARGSARWVALGWGDRETILAAERDAKANALRVVSALNLTWDQKVQDYLTRNPPARSQIEKALRRARLVDERLDVIAAHAAIEVPFFGPQGIATGLLGDRALVPQADAPAAPPPAPGTEETSGLVVDARGHQVGSALLFRIVDDRGGVVYAPGMVDITQLRSGGTGGYVQCQRRGAGGIRSPGHSAGTGALLQVRPVRLLVPSHQAVAAPTWWLAQAAPAAPRTGRRPLAVKGAPDGVKGVTIVVGQQDAARIRQADAASGILRKGNVLVVVDPETAGTEGRLRLPWIAEAAGLRP